MAVRLAKRFRRKFWTAKARKEAKKRGMTQEEWLQEVFQKATVKEASEEMKSTLRWRASKVGRQTLDTRRRARKKTRMGYDKIAEPIPADPTPGPSELFSKDSTLL